MTIAMKDTKIKNIYELEAFLKTTSGFEFRAKIKNEKYLWIEKTLGKFKYLRLKKKNRGLVRSYLIKMTGYSSPQITRLIDKYKKNNLKIKPYNRNKFSNKYILKKLHYVLNLFAQNNDNIFFY